MIRSAEGDPVTPPPPARWLFAPPQVPELHTVEVPVRQTVDRIVEVPVDRIVERIVPRPPPGQGVRSSEWPPQRLLGEGGLASSLEKGKERG